jgi:lysyl-tRNA synthetase class 2
MLQDIRAFFASGKVLEVETPILSRSATSEVHLSSWRAFTPTKPANEYALHTSPELMMKRLLAAGSGDIYQICKVFRADEQGRRHAPEFSLLEWYRVGFDMVALMREVERLLNLILIKQIMAPAYIKTYLDVFLEYINCDPLQATTEELAAIYQRENSAQIVSPMGKQDWLDLILSEVIQPRLPHDRLVFITQFPAEQASLAQLDNTDPRVARRFEVFCNGMELANGFEELTDHTEQHLRMQNENKIRAEKGLPQVKLDEHFLAALQAGMPACSGVAVGLDRLLMLLLDVDDIDQVLTFSFERI